MRILNEDEIVYTEPADYRLLSEDEIIFAEPEASWGEILTATGKKLPHTVAQSVAGAVQSAATGGHVKSVPDMLPFIPEPIKETARKVLGSVYDYGQRLVGGDSSQKVAKEYAEYGKAASGEISKIQSQLNLDDNSIKYHASNILDSLAMNAPGMLAGLATRQRAFALTPIGVQKYGQEFDENLRAGLTPADSHKRAMVSSGAEVLTESLTFGVLSKIGETFLKRLAKTVGVEVGGEQIVTLADAILQKTGRTPGYTIGDYLRDARDTFFAAAGQSGVMATAAHPIVRMQERGMQKKIDAISQPAETPVDETLVEVPAHEIIIDETPVVETPIVETPVDEPLAAETPIVETPVVETPVDETPIEETLVVETPVAETLVEIPIEEIIIDDAPVGLSTDNRLAIIEQKIQSLPPLLKSLFNSRRNYYISQQMSELDAYKKALGDVSNTVLGQQFISLDDIAYLEGEGDIIPDDADVETPITEPEPEPLIPLSDIEYLEGEGGIIPGDDIWTQALKQTPEIEIIPETEITHEPERIPEPMPMPKQKPMPKTESKPVVGKILKERDIIANVAKFAHMKNQAVSDGEYLHVFDAELSVRVKTQLPSGTYKVIGKDIVKSSTPADKFPASDYAGGKVVAQSNSNALSVALKNARNFMTDERHNMSGVFINITNEGIEIAATDSFRLYRTFIPVKVSMQTSFILENPDSLNKIITTIGDNINITETKEKVIFSGDRGDIAVVKIHDKFIDFRKAIPIFTSELEIDRKDFLSALKDVAPYTGEGKKVFLNKQHGSIIVAATNEDGITKEVAVKHKERKISTQDGEIENGVVVMPIRGDDGDSNRIRFNLDYLKGAVSILSGENLIIRRPDNLNAPVFFTDEIANPPPDKPKTKPKPKAKVKIDEPEKKAFEGQEGHLNLSAIIDGIKSINPFNRNKIEAAGIKLTDAKKTLTGENGNIVKLWAVPFWVGKKWKDFGNVFNAIQNSIHEASETISHAKDVFDDKTISVVRDKGDFAKVVYEGMERFVDRYAPSVDGLVASRIITKEEANTFKKIDDKMPPMTRRVGAVITEMEYLDRNVYNGLLAIAEKLGVKHKRAIAIGRGVLGYATPSDIVTQYATELDILAHEIGHVIDNQYGLWEKLGKRGRGKELMALADLRMEGIFDRVTGYYKKYIRKKSEKMAVITQAYIHMPDRFREIAPNVYKAFDSFIKQDPILKDLAEIRKGLVHTENVLFRQGNVYDILKNFNEKDAMTYIKVLSLTTNWAESNQSLIDKGVPESEIITSKGRGAKWTRSELSDRGFNDAEINAYQDMYSAVEEYGTKEYVDGKKWRAGFYKDIDPLQRAVLELRLRNSIKKYGAYLPLMRFGDYFVKYQSHDGITNVVAFEKMSEALAFKKESGGEIINIKDKNKRQHLFPHMTLHQLDMLIDNSNVSMADEEIKKIRELLLSKLGDTRAIQRHWTPGYFRTNDNLIKTVESYIDASVRYKAKQKANATALEKINKIENADLKEYALRYLDIYNQAQTDAKVFELVRNTASIIYLSLKVSYGIANLTSQLTTTYPRMVKDVGVFKAAKYWAEARLLASKYHAYSIAKMLGQDTSMFNVEPKLEMILDRLKRQSILRGTLTNELLDLRHGIKSMQSGDIAIDKAKQAIGIVGNLTERDNRLHAAIAAYLVKKDAGLTGEQMLDAVKDYIGGTQWFYERINNPVKMREIDKHMRGAIRTAWLFQSWAHNYLSMLSAYGRGAVKGDTGDMKALVTAVIAQASLTGIKGLPLASLIAAVWALSTGEPPDRQLREALGEKNKELADMILYGWVSERTGVDLSSIIGVGRFPGINYELLAATGKIDPETAVGGLWDRGRIAKHHIENEKHWAAASLLLDATKNYQMAKKWEDEGAVRKLRGERLGDIVPTETDIALKKLSFQPLKVSKGYEKELSDKFIGRTSKEESDKYADMLADAIYRKDSEKRQRIIEEIKKRKLDVTSEMIDERMKRMLRGKPDTAYRRDVRERIHAGKELY